MCEKLSVMQVLALPRFCATNLKNTLMKDLVTSGQRLIRIPPPPPPQKWKLLDLGAVRWCAGVWTLIAVSPTDTILFDWCLDFFLFGAMEMYFTGALLHELIYCYSWPRISYSFWSSGYCMATWQRHCSLQREYIDSVLTAFTIRFKSNNKLTFLHSMVTAGLNLNTTSWILQRVNKG